MLEKYQNFKKISKVDGCSFYLAEDRIANQNVLLKRLEQKLTWDSLLTNPTLQFMAKAKFCPKMIEIFKKKGYYFIVYEKPIGCSLNDTETIGRLPLHKFYPVFYDLCESCMQLKMQNSQAYILPQWIFMNRNLCKICHFEPFTSENSDANKHVFMYNLEKAIEQSGRQGVDSDVMSIERKKSLVFNLGAIAYQLLTGKKATNATTQEEYIQQLSELEQEVYKRIQRVTKQQKLAELVTKMIKQDPFDCPTLNQVYNFVKRQSKAYEPKQVGNTTVELDIEKIQLTDKYKHQSARKNKFTRPCCRTTENEEGQISLEKKGNLTVAYMRKNHTKNLSFLPQISQSRRKQQSRETFSKPTMFKSEGDLKLKGL